MLRLLLAPRSPRVAICTLCLRSFSCPWIISKRISFLECYFQRLSTQQTSPFSEIPFLLPHLQQLYYLFHSTIRQHCHGISISLYPDAFSIVSKQSSYSLPYSQIVTFSVKPFLLSLQPEGCGGSRWISANYARVPLL